MKKLITILALSLVVSSTYAQKTKSTKVEKETSKMSDDETSSEYKPSKGSLTTEVGFLGATSGAINELNNSSNFSGKPILRFRYFHKDDLAIRLGLSTIRNSNENTPKTDVSVSPGPSPAPSPNSVTTFSSTSSFDINLGAEKHFRGSDRLSTYAGADILFGFTGSTSKETLNPSGDFVEVKNDTGNNYFGLGLFTGADYYIAKKLYLGVELGLRLTTKNLRDRVETERVTTGGTSTTTTITTSDRGSDFELTPTIVSAIRLGYQF
jgi:hypothetical protein